MSSETVPARYIPKGLTKKDSSMIRSELKKSRRMYRLGKYHTRRKVPSFKSRPSKHLQKARKLYGVAAIKPSRELAIKTGCSIEALQKIVSKGKGAYFSGGSRPNQTPQSWGIARLASAITGGKSSAVDYYILKKGCKKTSKARKLAKKPSFGTRRVPQRKL